MGISLVLYGIWPNFQGPRLREEGHALNDFRRIGRRNNDLGCFCGRRIKAIRRCIKAMAVTIAAVIAAVIATGARDDRPNTGHQPAAASCNPVPPMRTSPEVGERAPAL
jgi:hypothetical protein